MRRRPGCVRQLRHLRRGARGGGRLILGIDPGLASTGFAVVDGRPGKLRCAHWGMLRTTPRQEQAERLRILHAGITELAQHEGIEQAAIESWYVHPVSRSAMAMAEARGAILAALAGAGLSVAEYPPTTIKKAVTSSGSADKRQVRTMVTALVGQEPENDHVADATAVAICHFASGGLARAIRAQR